MHHSIIPRVNTISTLYTYDYQKGRTSSFKLFDQYDGNHVIHKVETACRSQYADFVNNNGTASLTKDTIINNNSDTLLYINKPFRLHISKKKKFPFIRISFSGKQLKTYLAMRLGQRELINIDYPFKIHVTLHKHFPFIRISGTFDSFGKYRILYDITTLGSGFASPQNRTGVYRVSEEALSALINDNRLIIYVYSSQNNKDECLAYLKYYHPELINNFVKSKCNNNLHKLINIFNPKYRACLSPYFEIPQKFRHLLLCKKIYIIYDLIQVNFPQFVNKIDTVKYSHFLKKISAHDTVLCISHYTMNDFKQQKNKVKNISVIPLGVASHFKKDISPDFLSKIIRKYNLPKKYFFSISSLNPRKNFAHVIKSFIMFIEQYQRHDVSLLIAGPEGWGDLFDGIDMKKYEDQIRFIGFIPDEELPVLYRNAVASVYMSLYEGFGLPLLESIACGTPVIASNTSSIPEVIGDAGILLDPHDQNGLAEAYYRILTERGLRERLLQNTDEILKKYTWENFANALRDKIL